MTVDIIIPTYKPDETLCLLLHKMQGQTFVVHRVIILNTEEALWKQAVAAYPIEQVLQELPCEHEVIHIAKKDFDHGGTRQFGAEYSDADVMIFMTQDAVPADEFLVEKLVEALGTGGESESKQKSAERDLGKSGGGTIQICI
jgi:rhamnosyltransferase